MTARPAAGRLDWTRLGAVMGYTRGPEQRQEILTALGGMTWTPASTCSPCPPAVRAIARVLFPPGRDALQLVGLGLLTGGRQLIGLAGASGNRAYLVAHAAEAICVLTELPEPDVHARVA